MNLVLEFIATLSAGLFCGAAIYINLVEHPARMHSNIYWLVGGILIIMVIPFTAIGILPTNKRLLDSSLDKDSEYARQLLNRWGRLHAVRSLLSLVSLLIFLYALIWT